MPRLFDGLVNVHYGQFYLVSGTDPGADLLDHFRGQNNGLCGAAVPGSLFLITSTHTGSVAVTIDLHESAPAIDAAQEEGVEVPFEASGGASALVEWMPGNEKRLPLPPGSYRARYSATGMDQGGDADTLEPSQAADDRYHLDFWPAPPEPDAILKQSSQAAAYWHGWVKRPDQDAS